MTTRLPFFSLDESGFTLVELLVTSSIVVVAGFLMLMIFVQSDNTVLRQNNLVSQGLGLNSTVSQISEDIRSATSVAASYVSAGTTYTSNLSTLVLALPPLDGSGDPVTSPANLDYLVITPDSSNPSFIKRMIFPSTSNPVSTRVSQNKVLIANASSLKFYYHDKNGVTTTPVNAAKINFALFISQKGGLGTQQSSASADVDLRNN